MNQVVSSSPPCCCSQKAEPFKEVKPITSKQKPINVISSSLLGFVIAFFPKCPVCWAAYMSMFGSFGLSNIPYIPWLLPVLISFLALHLFFIFKKIKVKGYGPFAISLIGASVIIIGRTFFPLNSSLLFLGMAFTLIGSLWNSFSIPHFKFNYQSSIQ